MPSTAAISNFQRTFPNVALWCQDEGNEGIPDFGAVYRGPEDRFQIIDLIVQRRNDYPSEPARMYECTNIPNGDWSIRADGIVHEYRVWRVQSGPLAGQRIVKHRDRNGTFRGFAFITRDGNIRVWSRFASQRTSPHTLAFARALEVAEGRANDHLIQIVIRTRCPICNAYTTESDLEANVLVPLCRNHANIRDSHPGTPTFVDLDDDEDDDEPLETSVTPSCPHSLLLCENGTGIVR